ncbi:41016_t:CDS:2, partial [Gigaspora margarita]
MLTQVNPYVREIATIIHADNTVNVHPCSITIWCNTDIMPKFISIFKKAKHNQTNITIEKDFENENNKNEEGDLQLPASFLGSKRWCSSHVANALALAHCKGKPSFFITITTNPNWKEIQSQSQSGQNALEIAPIV